MLAGKRSIWTALGFAWALASFFAAPAVEAQVGTRAGVTAAVRGPVQQISYRTPQGVGRNVGSGDQVYLGDRIVTGPGGGVQILLLDGTTFSVGPNSSLVIDEFVYNPATGAGRLTASVARGTLRIISGKLNRQDREAIRIRLPMGTVGVRGTMVVLTGNESGFSIILSGIGANNSADRPYSYVVFYNPNGTTNPMTRAGFMCTVTPGAGCTPKPVDASLLQTIVSQISGSPQLNLNEFLRLSGMDLVTALQLLQSPGGFEKFWDLVAQYEQSRNRPGNVPPSTPPYCPSCY
jgi:hypothetical protein